VELNLHAGSPRGGATGLSFPATRPARVNPPEYYRDQRPLPQLAILPMITDVIRADIV
jgi:hypothetical protein